ncbi:MAG: class I SAM-dependent methyltransferase [Actinobacteria bacterium]|nr:class I SAM-dependent methyltransferase [Thermoleophilia bacterium]MCB9010748.1 class I SAM-dependent methyltransferase [Actinomycetota bacterium]
MSTLLTPDYAQIKQRQQATWASGDFGVIGATLQLVGEHLCEAVDVLSGQRVVDVAAGSGTASLAAARRFARVTSTDFVPDLLAQGVRRAHAEHLTLTTRVADAEALPFADDSFDAALSTFGVMFTPDHATAAAEMVRVVRPGGRIGLANWTPEGFLGDMFRIVAAFVPPPAGLTSPMRWGTETGLVELFGSAAADINCERIDHMFRYESPEHFVDLFRRYYGPTHRAFAALDEAGQRDMREQLLALLRDRSRPGTSAMVVPGEYLQVVVTLADA